MSAPVGRGYDYIKGASNRAKIPAVFAVWHNNAQGGPGRGAKGKCLIALNTSHRFKQESTAPNKIQIAFIHRFADKMRSQNISSIIQDRIQYKTSPSPSTRCNYGQRLHAFLQNHCLRTLVSPKVRAVVKSHSVGTIANAISLALNLSRLSTWCTHSFSLQS